MLAAMAMQESPPIRPSRRPWRKVRPRSVTGLLLAGFALVALPLVAATIYSVAHVDQLADQSERLVLRGVQTARASKKLDTIITDMERNARQYQILDKAVFIERFVQHKAAFDDTLNTLRQLKLESMPSWNLNSLATQADTLVAAMHAQPSTIGQHLAAFDTMHKEAALIARQGSVYVDEKLQRLHTETQNTRRFLLWCLFMLVPGAIILATVFTIVISRPVRQIIRAIERLGRGDFDTPIHVSAPSAEMDTLSRQLDHMRQRLMTLEAERNQFLRRMSHELKTPLASIREGAELLHDGTVGPLQPAQEEVADIIRHNSLELMQLIENLLDFSAWQQQKPKLEHSRFDLRALCATISNRQKLSIDGKQLTVTLPTAAMPVVADKERVHLIIDNLLSNAIKFSPRGGTIDIQLVHGSDCVTLAVSDAGPGIDPAERELIFEAFYQSPHAQEDTRLRGTGIGLSVVSECVHAHSGRISISDSADGGACFTIMLPEHGGIA